MQLILWTSLVYVKQKEIKVISLRIKLIVLFDEQRKTSVRERKREKQHVIIK